MKPEFEPTIAERLIGARVDTPITMAELSGALAVSLAKSSASCRFRRSAMLMRTLLSTVSKVGSVW